MPARFSFSAHQPLSVTAGSKAAKRPSSGCSPGTLCRRVQNVRSVTGDVTCWPGHGHWGTGGVHRPALAVGSSPPGSPADQIAAFPTAPYETVPAGAEADFLDLDGLIADLFRCKRLTVFDDGSGWPTSARLRARSPRPAGCHRTRASNVRAPTCRPGVRRGCWEMKIRPLCRALTAA